MTVMMLAVALLQGHVTVSPNGPYQTIASAVAAAAPGDTVVVRRGVYREPTVRIDRGVTVVGEPGAVLDGEGMRQLMVITGDGASVRGLTFRNTGSSYHEDRAAVHADSASNCRIEGNRFERTFFAIYLARTEGCSVRHNVVIGVPTTETATGNAIHSWGSRDLLVEGNRVSGHRDGLYFEFTRHATVRDNVSERHLRYGLHFMYADSSSYTRNVFRRNGSGVAVMYSKVVSMTANIFSHNRGPTAYGLLLKEIADVRLHRNTFRGNTTGLLADGADRVQVIDNRFEGNGWAIRLLSSTSGGSFRGNAFAGNSFDVAVNSRNTTPDFESNWWDAYRGWDLDRDGTGDVVHHPVRLFAMLVERAPAAMMLQRSLFVRVLDAAERVLPVLTPLNVTDSSPLMRASAGVPK